MRTIRKHLTFPNIVAGFVCLLSLPILYWAIIDRRPVAASVSEVISREVMQGDFLQIDYKVTWTSECEVVAFRYIIDEMQVEWPISAQQRVVSPEPDGQPSEFTIRIPVPMAASPGNATYRGTLRYICNPVQRFFPLEQDLRERAFVILENPNLAWRRREGVFEGPPIMRRFAGIAG
jgi:hypothetical protein